MAHPTSQVRFADIFKILYVSRTLLQAVTDEARKKTSPCRARPLFLPPLLPTPAAPVILIPLEITNLWSSHYAPENSGDSCPNNPGPGSESCACLRLVYSHLHDSRRNPAGRSVTARKSPGYCWYGNRCIPDCHGDRPDTPLKYAGI